MVFNNISINSGSTSSNAAKNTDGWNIYRSDNVTIQNSIIVNGDDCVAFKPSMTLVSMNIIHRITKILFQMLQMYSSKTLIVRVPS